MSSHPGENAWRQFIHKIFTAVPRHYDLINRIMTWGLDGRWRRKAARECLLSQPGRLLDLGCGTGDFTIELTRQARNSSVVIGIDFSWTMLKIAVQKGKRLHNNGRLSFVHGDAADMPFPKGYFNSIVTSFAFRNLTYNNPLLRNYIAEVLRVLSTGGRFIILETSQPKSRFIRKLYHLYMCYFIFWLGYLISGSREAYRYLAESVTYYYSPEELKQVLLGVGFQQVSFRRFLFGVVSIHIATK